MGVSDRVTDRIICKSLSSFFSYLLFFLSMSVCVIKTEVGSKGRGQKCKKSISNINVLVILLDKYQIKG